MVIYEDIARLAAETGWSPDFVIYVCFWITMVMGALLQSVVIVISVCLYRLLKSRR